MQGALGKNGESGASRRLVPLADGSGSRRLSWGTLEGAGAGAETTTAARRCPARPPPFVCRSGAAGRQMGSATRRCVCLCK